MYPPAHGEWHEGVRERLLPLAVSFILIDVDFEKNVTENSSVVLMR